MTTALDGILVLDTTTAFWASLGTALLADFGARVAKIETLPHARHARMTPDETQPPIDAGRDYRFALANRNKLSLAVDPQTDAGRAIVDGLVAQADIFVTDQPRAELDAAGRDYTRLSSLKPDLIYARASGFGPDGPDRDLPALDELAAARTGMMPILPQPGEPPVYLGTGQMYTSVMLAFGVAAALEHRHKTGEGQEVDVSLLAGNMYGASLDVQAYLAIEGDRFLRPLSRLDAGNPMSGPVYPTQDGLWVTLTMPDTGRYWPAFAEVVGLEVDDARFDTHEKRCEDNRLEMIGVLDDLFRQKPAAHWRAAFRERGLSGDVIERYDYPANDEQARRNRYIMEINGGAAGAMHSVGFPIYMTETPAVLERAAPDLGAHSSGLLRELLGYDGEKMAALEASGVVA